jgi:hypothetical protein
MPFKTGQTIPGQVVEIGSEGLVVSLPDGETGVIDLPLSTGRTIRGESRPGDPITVRVVGRRADGRHRLQPVQREVPIESPSGDAFDRAFHRLNHVLKSRAPSQPTVPARREAVIEERIEAWIVEAEGGLERLRKHRNRRLSEDLRDKRKQGGDRGERNRRHR